VIISVVVIEQPPLAVVGQGQCAGLRYKNLDASQAQHDVLSIKRCDE
jgi:hypothetical protein